MGSYDPGSNRTVKILLFIALLIMSAPAWATSYFISATGSDGNNGLSSGAPWLSPNHALNCGDTITAAASSSYSASNFAGGKWGTVTCPSSNNVAWLICATFDACKISNTAALNGMTIDKSYWGVTGWEITTSGQNWTTCFNATPPNSSTIIHHIIFVNNVANGCEGGGFSFYNNGVAGSEDYLVLVGNIAYNAAQGSLNCFSGVSVFEPLNADTVAGTHIYVAGNYSYGNFNPSTCAGTAPTDGEGIIIDTPDQRDNSGGAPYTQQIVVQNNIAVGNGGRGILVANNSMGSTHAPVYVLHNTNYGNNQSTTGASFTCGFQGEIGETSAYNTTATSNLNMTSSANGCSSAAIWAFSMSTGNGTDTVSGNWLYSAAGNTTFLSSSPGFSYGSNTTGTNPSFASTTVPGAPSCSGKANVADCMSSLLANFTPTAGGSTAYGYQTVSNTSVNDSLFPQWLCASPGTLNANIPANLITPGCGVSGTITSGMHCQSGTSGGLPGPGGSPPTQGVPCG